MAHHRPLIALGMIIMLVVGMTSPIAAHETQNVEGYDVTFGGADEPLITGERMWLELKIVSNVSGEPVENQADALNMYVQTGGNDRAEINLSEKHNESGVYQAAVIFTEPGEYVIHVEGEIEGTEVHTHFEKVVEDRTELEYPGEEPSGDGSETATGSENTQTDNDQTEEAGLGSAISVGFGAIVVAGMIGALVWGRRR